MTITILPGKEYDALWDGLEVNQRFTDEKIFAMGYGNLRIAWDTFIRDPHGGLTSPLKEGMLEYLVQPDLRKIRGEIYNAAQPTVVMTDLTDIWAPVIPWWTPSGELTTRSPEAYYSGKPYPQMTNAEYDAMKREQKLVSHDWRTVPITSRDGRAAEVYPHDIRLYPGLHDDTYGVIATQWLT